MEDKSEPYTEPLLAENQAEQPVINQQPQVVYVEQPKQPPHPYTRLIYAVFVTMCCFWPVGAFAIYKEVQARKQYQYRDYKGAQKSSDESKLLSHIALAIGLLVNVLGWGIAIVTNAVAFGVLAALGLLNVNATSVPTVATPITGI